MNAHKFDQMVKEFPFLVKVFAEMNLSADSISNIVVKRGDRNLLGAKPGSWCFDGESAGMDCGSRYFWCVVSGEVIRLNAGHCKTDIIHGVRCRNDAAQIGTQILDLKRDIQFVVEIHEEHWDWEEPVSDVVIYKLQDWRRFYRPAQIAAWLS